jgi:hypothetical protein
MNIFKRAADALSGAPPRVGVANGVIEFAEKGRLRKIPVADLVEVGIITSDAGPFSDDVFWMLATDKTRVLVPWAAVGAETLLAALQDLPGFDHEAVAEASASTEPAAWRAWTR